MTPTMMASAMVPLGMGIASNTYGNATSQSYEQMAQQLQQAQDVINKYLGNATGYMQPFYNAGISGLNNFQTGLNPLANPVQLMSNLMGQYTMSPYAQAQMNQEITAANAAGSASGMLGSGAEQKALEQSAQQITSKDMQNWLNNIFGIYKGYLGGEKSLMNQGFNAGSKMGQWNMQAGEDITDLMAAQAQAEAAAKQSKAAGDSGLIGGITNMLF